MQFLEINMNKIFNNKRIPTNRGQAMMVAVVFFLAGSLVVLGGVASPVLKDIKTSRNLEKSKQSNYLSESGVEDVVYRIKNSMNYSDTESLTVNGISATTTNVVVASSREVTALGDKDNIIRTIKAIISEGSVSESFDYVLQSGVGGMEVNDAATITGDIFSDSPIVGENTNTITGNAVSTGSGGLINNMTVTGNAYANTINNSSIGGDAYYQSISGTTVGGISYPGSPDIGAGTMPITDSDIDTLKAGAEAGGVISSPCPYVITSNTTIGPVKINCDLTILDVPTVTLEGDIWVVGDIVIEDSSTVKVASSLGEQSVTIIADNPADREDSSTVSIKNDATFEGSGTDGSYVVVISQNNDAESGGDDEAIEVKNSASGDLFVYASHGIVLVKNSATVKGLVGYEVEVKNSAQVDGNTNIINMPPLGGSGGEFSLDSWLEI